MCSVVGGGRAGALPARRRAHGRADAPPGAERGALQLARAELVGRDHRDRHATRRIRYVEPFDSSASSATRAPSSKARSFAELVHPGRRRPRDRRALDASPEASGVRTRPSSCGSATGRIPGSRSRRSRRTCSTTRPSPGIVLNTRDVSERKAFERQLEHHAFYDTVTGLANRALFKDRVDARARPGAPDPGSVAVLFMDLDDFKVVNDSFGHAAGDALLRAVGERAARLPARLATPPRGSAATSSRSCSRTPTTPAGRPTWPSGSCSALEPPFPVEQNRRQRPRQPRHRVRAQRPERAGERPT